MRPKIIRQRISLRRERKEFKRRRNRHKKKGRNKKYLFSIYSRKLKNLRERGYSSLSKYFDVHLFNKSLAAYYLEVPEIFCFEENNEKSLLFLKKVFSSLKFFSLNGEAEITLSFKECKVLRLGPLMLLNLIIRDFFKWRRKAVNKGLSPDFLPKLELKDEMSAEINNLLFTMHFPVKVKASNKIPILGFRLLEGVVNAQDYVENSKGKISRKVRTYVNTCLKMYGIELDLPGIGLFDNMIGEILANADDHSLVDSWYVYGSFSVISDSKEDDKSFELGELNLIFLNFGNSFFEGFESTKELNKIMYSDMERLYSKVINTSKLKKAFNKESMFTLYGLQEGFSSLLHTDKSRGIGTMTFIRSFMELGYNSNEYKSILYILSGRSLIKCTKNYKPIFKNGRYYLPLNVENDLTLPPSNNNVRCFKENFPGTLLLTKIYLDKNHLKEITDGKQ